MPNYLFNGLPLPKLPEWDKSAYPYAFIYYYAGGDRYFLYCYSEPATVTDYTSVDGGYSVTIMKPILVSRLESGETEWGTLEDWSIQNPNYSGSETNTKTIIWSNTDITYKETVILAASDPVPILAPALDPLSLFLGWKAGNWVARQRGKKVEQPSTGGYDDTMPIEWNTLDVANNFRIPAETVQIYSWNGYEFGAPAIDADSDCKYHIIHKYENGYYYTCTNKPFMYTEDNNKYAEIKESLKRIVYVCSGDDIGFVHSDDLADSGLRVLWDNIIWTNTDISDADGTVRMAATEPVYVREQVVLELIKVSNYIPTDEMINNHAISIQSGGDEVVLSSPYASPMDDEGNNVSVLFMDFEVGLVVFMFYFKQEIIAEGQAVEPGLYYSDSIPSIYPPDTKFKFYIPDET